MRGGSRREERWKSRSESYAFPLGVAENHQLRLKITDEASIAGRLASNQIPQTTEVIELAVAGDLSRFGNALALTVIGVIEASFLRRGSRLSEGVQK